MKSEAKTPTEYIESLDDDRKKIIKKLRSVIKKKLPKGFKEEMNYGMIGYVVPHKIFPEGYHCDPKLPLPFLNIANQKNFIGFYHMGLYSMPKLLKWFQDEFPKRSSRKLDMGKSCVRFKHFDDIPYDLLGELVAKVSVEEWIEFYQKSRK